MIGTKRIAAALGLVASLACGAAAQAAEDWQAGAGADWQKILAAARQEGKVVLASEVGATAAPLAAAFLRDTGITLEVLTGGVSEVSARMQREAEAGNPTLDVAIGGGGELITLYPRGLLNPIKPQLLLPGVADGKNWRAGHLKWMDTEGQYMLQTTEYVSARPAVNTDLVDPKAIRSWQDLLKPEYKGKIASFDPRPAGPGQALASYLVHTLGPEYLKSLYVGQAVAYTRDGRQLVEWAVRGTYAIILASVQGDVERFRNQGVQNIAPLDLLDGAGAVLGGFSIVKQIKNVPHPNAATVFINWFASRPGQEIYSRATLEPSRRIDAMVDVVPDYVVPRPGVQYLDTYDEPFYSKIRPGLRTVIIETLGGR
jgi:ABC-type Fe3+ transport system substrate-binding protein